MENKLTTKIIILRKKLAVMPVGLVPILAVLFYTFGGGSNIQATENNDQGFNVNIPQSENSSIANSKNDAYTEEKESYMGKFNTEVPEIELETKTDEIWKEEEKDKFDANTDLLSVYEKHNSNLEKRRNLSYNNNEQASNNSYDYNESSVKKVKKKVINEEEDLIVENNPPTLVNNQAEQETKPKRRVFHDNSGSSINNKTISNSEITAVIHSDQKIGGSKNRVKLRTTKTGIFNGITVPKNTIVYANASINNNRLHLIINNISLGQKTEILQLNVYDASDGNLGLNLSTNLTSDETNRVGSDVIRQGGNVISSTGIIGAVVTGTTGAIGNIFSKNNNNNSIQLLSNHQVILK